jgi:tetratricopeptide (TPR) repeat protein
LIHLLVLYKAVQIVNSRSETDRHLKGVAIIWILVFSQSLLSIEIIGLGVMNWVLGGVILSSGTSLISKGSNETKADGKKKQIQRFPAWVGSIAIAAILLGSIPMVILSRENSAYRNVALFEVNDQASKDWIRDNFNKLTDISLLSPEQVFRILQNLYRADMFSETGDVVSRLYETSPKDALAGDLLATHYINTKQIEKEIELREEMRSLDPWNYLLELALAQAYARAGRDSELEKSVAIIKRLAPESSEYEQAKALLDSATSTTP